MIWVQAARPRTLPAAIAPVLVGTAAAWQYAGHLPRVLAFVGGADRLDLHPDRRPTSPTTTPTRAAAPTPPTGSGRCGSPRPGLVTPQRVLTATWVAFAVAVACGIYLAIVAGWVILLVGAASIAAGRPLHRRPAPLRLRRARRGLRLPLLRPRRRQRELLRADSKNWRAAARPLDRGRLPRHRDPRRQQRPRPGDRPARGQEHLGGADGPRQRGQHVPAPGRRRLRAAALHDLGGRMPVVAAARPAGDPAGDQTAPGDGNAHRRPGAEQSPRRDRRPARASTACWSRSACSSRPESAQ